MRWDNHGCTVRKGPFLKKAPLQCTWCVLLAVGFEELQTLGVCNALRGPQTHMPGKVYNSGSYPSVVYTAGN